MECRSSLAEAKQKVLPAQALHKAFFSEHSLLKRMRYTKLLEKFPTFTSEHSLEIQLWEYGEVALGVKLVQSVCNLGERSVVLIKLMQK